MSDSLRRHHLFVGDLLGRMIGGGNQGLTPVVGVFETAALIFCAARDFTPIYQQIILDTIRQHFSPILVIKGKWSAARLE